MNLMSFPWLAERVTAGKLVLHAWWFNLTEGQLYAFNPETAKFDPVLGVQVRPTVDRREEFVARIAPLMPYRLWAFLGRQASEGQ